MGGLRCTGRPANGNTEIVMLLLENKCNINVTTKDGNTPLIWAAREQQDDHCSRACMVPL